jgi:hypothetical protein
MWQLHRGGPEHTTEMNHIVPEQIYCNKCISGTNHRITMWQLHRGGPEHTTEMNHIVLKQLYLRQIDLFRNKSEYYNVATTQKRSGTYHGNESYCSKAIISATNVYPEQIIELQCDNYTGAVRNIPQKWIILFRNNYICNKYICSGTNHRITMWQLHRSVPEHTTEINHIVLKQLYLRQLYLFRNKS